MTPLSTRTRSFVPSDGSRTIVMHDSQPREEDAESGEGNEDELLGTLQLRGGPRSTRRVAWTDDVVDNEGKGKKKSKICCIYHKPKKFDESSDEGDSSDSDSDSSSAHNHSHHHRHHRHSHGDSGGDGAAALREGGGSIAVQEIEDNPGQNNYERQPYGKPNKGKGRADTG